MAEVTSKTAAERNKLIAAILLGVLALGALYFAFGRSLFSSSATTVKATPTPKINVTVKDPNKFTLPTAEEQTFNEVTVPIDYRPGTSYAPDAGRNIFAFYEPPPPTPYSPTPTPEIIITPATPAPTPVYLAGFVNPQSIYAGSPGFRLEVNGERFTPDVRIYFNQTEMPTTFINSQRIVTDIPASMITGEGSRQIIIQSIDGKSYSNPISLTVQAPPRPGFQYIGMIARKRYNNDTAYFLEGSKPTPFGARLNDIVGGRFRLINISAAEVVFEDTTLGFKHRLAIVRAAGGSGNPALPGSEPGRTIPGFPGIDPSTQPNNPTMVPQDIPGIPNNIPRYVPPPNPNVINPAKNPKDSKDDVDDDGDGDNFK